MSLRFISRLAKGFVQGSLRLLPGRRGLFARRWLAWEFLRGQVETVDFDRNGFRWSVFTNDIVGRGLFLHGEFQLDGLPELLTWCSQNVPHWETRTATINVGANIGATCLPLAKASGLKCLAVEPVPATFAMLERNVLLNAGKANVECRQAAVASVAGTVEMIAPRDSGHSEVKTATGEQGFSETYSAEDCTVAQVPAIPLDQLVTAAGLRPEQIGLVWSDTQGFESEVLASGKSLWKTGTPAWVEVWPRGLEMHGGVEHFLTQCRENFRQFILDDQFIAGGKIQPQPIDDLTQIIRDLQKRGGSGGREDHDVLLVP